MDILEHFRAYAAAFEESYSDDDWSRLEPFFTEDAVYQFDDVATGRSAVLKRFQDSVNQLDRRMDERVPTFDAPTASGDTVSFGWQVVYHKAGVPDLVLVGHETATYRDGRIVRLVDELEPESAASVAAWMEKHGAVLAE